MATDSKSVEELAVATVTSAVQEKTVAITAEEQTVAEERTARAETTTTTTATMTTTTTTTTTAETVTTMNKRTLVSAPTAALYPDVARLMLMALASRENRAALYPEVARLMLITLPSSNKNSTTTTTAVAVATAQTSVVVETSVEPPTAPAVKAATPPKAKKNWGSFLPKVPAMLLPKKDANTTNSTSEKKSNGSEHAPDHDADEHTDELRSLTEGTPTADKPASASVPLASRLRGLSIEQNAFASSIVRKFSGLRSQSQSSTDSPRNSIDGLPVSEKRRSLTSSLGLSGLGGGHSPPSPPHADPHSKARRGACVATKFGTGVVLDIRQDDGFYIVQLVPKSIAYLTEEMIVREIKSVVGERVKTRWGLATVEQYYVEEDMYSIALDWRWDDDHVWRMKATTKKFEKIPRSVSIVQNTKNKLFEGYSTIRESASFGYANVAAKINTTASTYKAASARPSVTTAASPQTQTTHDHLHAHGENLGKALTPYGICTVVEVRPDQFFVVQTKCGATAYLNADSVKLLHRRTNFAVGERVKTPYGTGEVVAYRDEDEVYEVKLDFAVALGSMPPTLYISDIHAESMLLSANANGPNYARLSSIFTMTRNSVYSASATVKASASGGLNTLSSVKSKVSTMAAIKMTKVKFQKGERVITSFGSGFVSDCRPLERIYEVQLRRLKFRGYFHESALTAFPYERVTHFIVDGKTIPAPEMPKSLPEHKRRNIINTAIRQAREGR